MENENRSYTVYMHVNKINNKKYIGITCMPLQKRFGCNGKGYMQHDTLFSRAIKKYGWNNFDHCILYANVSADEAQSLERQLIHEYQTQNPEYGYNHEAGGLCNDEWMRRQKLSLSHSGINHNFYGRHHSESTKSILSEKCSGENNYWYGKHLPEETKIKISNALTGNKNWVTHVEAQKVKVMCVETGIIYDSLNDAEQKTGIHHSGISMVLNGKRQTAGGYHWEKYMQTCS